MSPRRATLGDLRPGISLLYEGQEWVFRGFHQIGTDEAVAVIERNGTQLGVELAELWVAGPTSSDHLVRLPDSSSPWEEGPR